MLTVSRVLTTNMGQNSLGQLLFKATLKVRLDSCLSLLLEWTTVTAPNKCTFPKIHSLSVGGAYSRVEACKCKVSGVNGRPFDAAHNNVTYIL